MNSDILDPRIFKKKLPHLLELYTKRQLYSSYKKYALEYMHLLKLLRVYNKEYKPIFNVSEPAIDFLLLLKEWVKAILNSLTNISPDKLLARVYERLNQEAFVLKNLNLSETKTSSEANSSEDPFQLDYAFKPDQSSSLIQIIRQISRVLDLQQFWGLLLRPFEFCDLEDLDASIMSLLTLNQTRTTLFNFEAAFSTTLKSLINMHFNYTNPLKFYFFKNLKAQWVLKINSVLNPMITTFLNESLKIDEFSSDFEFKNKDAKILEVFTNFQVNTILIDTFDYTADIFKIKTSPLELYTKKLISHLSNPGIFL